MTRDDTLERYRPLRAAIQRVLKEAPRACRRPELQRALSAIAPWADESHLDGELLDMLEGFAGLLLGSETAPLIEHERDSRKSKALKRKSR